MLHVTPAALVLAALLSGCAITSSHDTGPSGQPVHFIDAMSAGTAYRKAQELCPGGYTLIGEPRMISVMDYVMTIECKASTARAAASSTSAAPAAALAPAASAAPVAAVSGKDQYVAGQAARAAACAAQPEPRLLASEPGAETYTVACDQGGVLLLRCEFGNCRAMK